MSVYNLNKWSVTATEDYYTAPECRSICLVGHRGDEAEGIIRTSRIVKVEGKTITTHSGSVYLLQEIDPEYLAWLQKQNISYDPDNPIKVKVS